MDSTGSFFCLRFNNNSHYLFEDSSTEIQRRMQARENIPFVQMFSLNERPNRKTIEQLQLWHSNT